MKLEPGKEAVLPRGSLLGNHPQNTLGASSLWGQKWKSAGCPKLCFPLNTLKWDLMLGRTLLYKPCLPNTVYCSHLAPSRLTSGYHDTSHQGKPASQTRSHAMSLWRTTGQGPQVLGAVGRRLEACLELAVLSTYHKHILHGSPSSLVNSLPSLCLFGTFLSFDSPAVKEMPALDRKRGGKLPGSGKAT